MPLHDGVDPPTFLVATDNTLTELTGPEHQPLGIGDDEREFQANERQLLSGERLIPSEYVPRIWPTRVEVSLTKAQIEALPPFENPPAVRIEPGVSGFFRRLFGR